MNKTYQLVELAKSNLKLSSDYAIANMLKVHRQMVSNWKSEKSEANALTTMKLAKAAGLTIEEAIEILEEKQPVQKRLFAQAGFTSLSLIFVTLITSSLALALFNTSTHCILCKIRLVKKIKPKLLRFAHENQMQSICVYLLQTN